MEDGDDYAECGGGVMHRCPICQRECDCEPGEAVDLDSEDYPELLEACCDCCGPELRCDYD